jgi:hypothetical protein
MKSKISDIVKESGDRTFKIANQLNERQRDRLLEIAELAAAILGVHAEIAAELNKERPGA